MKALSIWRGLRRKDDDIVLRENGRLFSKKDLAMLLIPLIVE